MIVIRVELHSANTRQVTELARMHICNDGEGTQTRGNYTGESFVGRDQAALDRRLVSRSGSVANFPRRDLHVWHLVARMLKNMGYTK